MRPAICQRVVRSRRPAGSWPSDLNMERRISPKGSMSSWTKARLPEEETQYAFHQTSLIAFHHETVADTAPHTGPLTPSRKHVKELWGDFFRNEMSYMFAEHMAEMMKQRGAVSPYGRPSGRWSAARTSVRRNPAGGELEAEDRERQRGESSGLADAGGVGRVRSPPYDVFFLL